VKLISALMATAVSAVAATSDPGETAVRFLEKVRAQDVDLSPGADTALAPSTSEAKRKEIARRLERMARDLGEGPLEVGKMKLDGDFAGVLVRKIGGFDPNRMQVFAIALVKRGADWAAAPVPASFENSGIGYASALRERLAALEDWMLREQVLDLAIMRDESAERMRRKIEENLTASTLKSFSPKQAAERFLAACGEGDLPVMFGLLGGLSANPPGDWPLRIETAERAISKGPEVTGPWRLLISKEVLRVIVHHEEDDRSALVSLACLDPAGDMPEGARPRVRLVHLDFTKSREGLWRINLPGYFMQEEEIPDDTAVEDLDSDLFDAFPEKVREQYPLAPRQTLESAREAVINALQDAYLPALIRLIRLDGDPAKARDACVRAASLWWAIREPSSVRLAVPLGNRETSDTACSTFQIFSARNPDRLDLKTLYFEKHEDGWLWTAYPEAKVVQESGDWIAAQSDEWHEAWQDKLLSDCEVLEKLPQGAAPSEDDARAQIDAWFKAIQAGDIPSALRQSARLNLPDSKATLLRNLGYELIGALKNRTAPTITGVRREGAWAAVETRAASNGKVTFPLYPVLATSTGPRVLPEIDLSEAGTRSRDFLNKTSLKRLGEFNAAAAESLQTLFSNHKASARKTDPRGPLPSPAPPKN
jgi:hypothetical protein